MGISGTVFTLFHLLSAYHSSDTILRDQRWALLATHYLLAQVLWSSPQWQPVGWTSTVGHGLQLPCVLPRLCPLAAFSQEGRRWRWRGWQRRGRRIPAVSAALGPRTLPGPRFTVAVKNWKKGQRWNTRIRCFAFAILNNKKKKLKKKNCCLPTSMFSYASKKIRVREERRNSSVLSRFWSRSF